MKFDVEVFRYIEKDAWRVLVSVEMGMKNHELVPVELINAISGLKHGGAFKFIRDLLKHKLVLTTTASTTPTVSPRSGTTTSPSRRSSTAAPSRASGGASASGRSQTSTKSSPRRVRRSR